MFEPKSRYSRIETATFTVSDPDGTSRQVVYKKRRFIPPADGQQPAAEHVVTEGERLDQIAARYLGDGTLFYLICDANGAVHPDELTDAVGRVLRITTAQF